METEPVSEIMHSVSNLFIAPDHFITSVIKNHHFPSWSLVSALQMEGSLLSETPIS